MNQPIDSLPELCSLEGATTTLGFTYCTTMSWISILFFLIIMRYRRSCEFELQMTDGLMYLGGFCLYGVHLFKLDRCRRMRQRFHLITTLIGAVCISTVCGVQQYSLGTAHWVRYLMVFVIMWFGFYAAFFHFGTTCYSEMVEKYSLIAVNKITDEDRKEISSLSRKIICCEMATILILAIGVANWMWFYDIGCAYGCRGPVKEECYWCFRWKKGRNPNVRCFRIMTENIGSDVGVQSE